MCVSSTGTRAGLVITVRAQDMQVGRLRWDAVELCVSKNVFFASHNFVKKLRGKKHGKIYIFCVGMSVSGLDMAVS